MPDRWQIRDAKSYQEFERRLDIVTYERSYVLELLGDGRMVQLGQIQRVGVPAVETDDQHFRLASMLAHAATMNIEILGIAKLELLGLLVGIDNRILARFERLTAVLGMMILDSYLHDFWQLARQ